MTKTESPIHVAAATLGDITIADEEIRAAQRAKPDQAEKISSAFPLLKRTSYLVSEILYRFHIRELIARHIAGEDTRLGTLSEVLGATANVIANVKPGWEGSLVSVALLERTGLIDEPGMREIASALKATVGTGDHPGEVDRIITESQRKFSDPSRVIPNNAV